MKSTLLQIERSLARLEEAAVFSLLVALVITLALQVASRFVFKFPLDWTEELARVGLMWLVFIGSAVAARRAEHFAVELFMEKVDFPGKHMVAWLVEVTVIGFFLMLALVAGEASHFGAVQTMPALGVSVAFATAAIPVGCALMAVHLLMTLVVGRELNLTREVIE